MNASILGLATLEVDNVFVKMVKFLKNIKNNNLFTSRTAERHRMLAVKKFQKSYNF